MAVTTEPRRGVPPLLMLGALLGSLAIGLTLWLWGQPLICTCGEVRLWVNSVFSGGNSQHIADWYTLSHIIHGALVALVGRWIGLRTGILLALALITGIGWEIVEHTDWVLDRFRATTINQGYVGDSVLNAVFDFLFMLGGFWLALRLPALWTLAGILALELAAILIARDSLILTTLMLIHEVPAIEAWQQELNPNADSPLPEAQG